MANFNELSRLVFKYITEKPIDAYILEDDKIKKGIRHIDVLNRQVKRGKITQDQFDKKYNDVNDKFSDKEEFPLLPKKGSKTKFDPNNDSARPSITTKTDLSSIIKGNIYHQRIDGIVDKDTFEKLRRHYYICLTTDNYNEYKQHHSQLCKMCGVPITSSICPGPIFSKSNYKVCIQFYSEKKKNASIRKDEKLYHTSTQRGLRRLNGFWKAKDGVLHSSMRVYFCTGNPGSRLSGSNKFVANSGTYVYEYNGPKNNVYVDPELHGNAVYIETNTSLPVKDVTDEFYERK